MASKLFSREFFARDAVCVARELLGARLVHETQEGIAVGKIVEVEAYCGPRDRAAHSFGWRRTPRNEVMYGPPGHAYVYFVYGRHHCFTIVGADVGMPEAVLVRAVEPLQGFELMLERRGLDHAVAPSAVARGPANMCRAMGIDLRHNGVDLLRGPLRLEPGPPVPAVRIAASPRIGVAYAGPDALRPWRFYEVGNPAVSGPRPRGR